MKNRSVLIWNLFLAGLFLLISSSWLSAQLYEPSQRTSPAPIDLGKFKEMARTRVQNHACMQKGKEALQIYKAAQLQSYTEPTPNMYDYDVLFYKIDIALDFNQSFISGYASTTLRSLKDGLSYIDLNLGQIYAVSQVTLDDSINLNFAQTDWFLLTSYLPQPLDSGEEATVTVYYSGYPNDFGAMRFYQDFGSYICYTSVEPFSARNWWPCKDFPFDKPDSVDVIATHPTANTFLSNGLRRSRVDNGNGTATTQWHERYPIATYLIFAACTDYVRADQSWQYAPGKSLPIEQYYYPGAPPDMWWSSAGYFLAYTVSSLESNSYWFTLYPFIEEKYGHNHFGWGGAMEHQTMTSISPTFNSEYVIAHECAHQWGGDLVTCRNFHHVWLQEGFASYAEILYFKYHYNDDRYKIWLESQKHLDAGSPYVENLETDDIFDGTTVYDKASWVYYMLHMILGDDRFRLAMDRYFHDPELAFGSAITADLQRVCESVYGAPLGWFFDEWVYQPGNPQYFYSFESEPNPKGDNYKISLFIDQRQPYGAFVMPIEIIAYAGDYDTSFTVFNRLRGQLFEFNLPYPADSIVLDPHEKILRTVEFEPGFNVHLVGEELADGKVSIPYYKQFMAVGGKPPYKWTKVFGQMPYGLTFHGEAEGYLDGIPTYAADYVFRLKVEDSSNPPRSSEYAFSLRIEPPPPMCGDLNSDQDVTVGDAVYLINYIYLGGNPPSPMLIGDVNCDTRINLVDAIYLINYVFRGGAIPCAKCPL